MSIHVETDMRPFEDALDEEFCHFGPTGSTVVNCGIPRSECINHGGQRVWPEDYQRGTCLTHGQPYCSGCMTLYWDSWS